MCDCIYICFLVPGHHVAPVIFSVCVCDGRFFFCVGGMKELYAAIVYTYYMSQ